MTTIISSSEDRRVWGLIGIMLLIGVLFVPFSQIVLDVQYTYTVRTVALGGAILGMISGVPGCFAVLRQESLMGDALSHAALPGVCIAFLLVGRNLGALLIGAGIASWLGVRFIQVLLDTTRIKQDSAMGIVLASWFAAGIALLAYIQSIPDASQAGLDSFIFGQAAAIIESDVQLISVVGLVMLGLLVVFWKEFKLVTFDPEFAIASGVRVGLINVLLSTLIVVAIVLGLQLAGVILMVGMLIAPGIAARQWTQKLNQMLILSAVFGAFAGGTGAILSAVDADVPTGPMIIVVAFTLVTISIAFAPGRGLVWTLLRQRGDRSRFAAQTTLRDLYKYALSHGSVNYPVPQKFIMGVGNNAGVGLSALEQDNLIQAQGDTWILTQAGIAFAEKDARNQELWNAYREYGETLKLPIIVEERQKPIEMLLDAAALSRLKAFMAGDET